MDWFFLISSFVKILLLVFCVIMPMVAYTVYAERRVCAMIQDRVGPNRTGWAGLAQPVADAVKLFLKEDFTPAYVNKFYYWLAPALTMIPALMVVAVIPFGSSINLDFILQPIFGKAYGDIPMVIADINAGMVFVFAITSLSVYGITLAGWSSNSKYPFLGGIRSTAQMISYEIGMGLSVIPLFMVVGHLNLTKIVEFQITNGWMIVPTTFFNGGDLKSILLFVPLLLSFIVFMICLFAETNRVPFDLPEAETELVGGYHTEYSSMKFALFFLGEYAAMIVGSCIAVTLFLGGWHLPWIPFLQDASGGWFVGLVHIGTFLSKVAMFLFFFIWVRWTLPRFRYDQLMKLGWVYIFEIALVNIFITAFILAYLPN